MKNIIICIYKNGLRVFRNFEKKEYECFEFGL